MAIDTSKILLDFEVYRTNSCKVLKLLDLSNWATAEADLAFVSILTPGSTVPAVLPFQKHKLNVFNTNNLGLSDVTDYSYLGPLPDGMYTITLLQCEGDPYAVTRYHLQDCQLRCQVNRKLIALDITCSPCRTELRNDVEEILFYLDVAQANSDACNINKAVECYQRAATLLDRISDNSGCKNC
jgi:hypothetical protein